MSNAGQDTETVFLGLALKHSKVHTIGESVCTQENVKLSETRESVEQVKRARKRAPREEHVEVCNR